MKLIKINKDLYFIVEYENYSIGIGDYYLDDNLSIIKSDVNIPKYKIIDKLVNVKYKILYSTKPFLDVTKLYLNFHDWYDDNSEGINYLNLSYKYKEMFNHDIGLSEDDWIYLYELECKVNLINDNLLSNLISDNRKKRINDILCR